MDAVVFGRDGHGSFAEANVARGLDAVVCSVYRQRSAVDAYEPAPFVLIVAGFDAIGAGFDRQIAIGYLNAILA